MDPIYRLNAITVLDLVGEDAGAILHNLTTNAVKSLQLDDSCETFLTDVRGKTLAHVICFKTAEGFRLIGAGGQADAIAGHADRYTIREDATPVDRSTDFIVAVAPAGLAESARSRTIDSWATDEKAADTIEFRAVPWLGKDSLLALADSAQTINELAASLGSEVLDEEAFHRARTLARFPWFGVDLSDKNLPQEANRIEQSISFTKGCYLGQETVARLDALGQVQKQLVCWKTSGEIPAPGSEVHADEKLVGRLTSLSPIGPTEAIAIGIARRTHFDPGAEATGDGFSAVVVE